MAKNFLTQAGFDKLQTELDYLLNEKRLEIAERLREAMDDGDIVENAEFEAAKNEQAFVEGRIQELQIILASAQIIENKGKSDIVIPGTIVTIVEDGEQPETYQIVGPAEANPAKGQISYESPLGSALMNQREGDVINVKAPAGSFTVKITKIE